MKKLDFLIIGLVIIIGALLYYIYFDTYRISADDVLFVEVIVENKVRHRVKLEETTNETFIIEHDGHYNVVKITYDEIKMIDADCPDKYCMRMFMNHKNFTPIICTNEVVVRIVGESFGDYDYIVP